jgi:hypothetical protein
MLLHGISMHMCWGGLFDWPSVPCVLYCAGVCWSCIPAAYTVARLRSLCLWVCTRQLEHSCIHHRVCLAPCLLVPSCGNCRHGPRPCTGQWYLVWLLLRTCFAGCSAFEWRIGLLAVLLGGVGSQGLRVFMQLWAAVYHPPCG